MMPVAYLFARRKKNKWDRYLIDKRDLARVIVEQMGRI